jgi:hypothetical protein
MDPSTFEDLLMLKMNRDLWDVYLVEEVVQELAKKPDDVVDAGEEDAEEEHDSDEEEEEEEND